MSSPLWACSRGGGCGCGCGCSDGSSSSDGATSMLLGVQARRCDERFCCRLWTQASMIVQEGRAQPGETCWGGEEKAVSS